MAQSARGEKRAREEEAENGCGPGAATDHRAHVPQRADTNAWHPSAAPSARDGKRARDDGLDEGGGPDVATDDRAHVHEQTWRRGPHGQSGERPRRRLREKTRCTQGDSDQGIWSKAGDECKGVVIDTSPREEESSAPSTRQLKTIKFTSQGRVRASCSTNSAAELVHAEGILPNVSEAAASADHCGEILR